MEKGEILPYDIMRNLVRAFGMDEMVRAQFKKLEEAGARGEKRERGGGGDPGLMAIVSMELSRVCPGFCLAFGASLGLAGGAIMAKGTLAQKQQWALPILTMEKIGAWGMTEPGAGSDAFGSMRTTARRDGDHFVLNGQKTFITNAPYADTFVIYAKLEGNEDVALSAVPRLHRRARHARAVDGQADGQDGHALVADGRGLPRGRARAGRAAHRRQARGALARGGARRVPRRAHRHGADVPRHHRALSRGFARLREAARDLGQEDRRVPARAGQAGAHVRARENVRNMLFRQLEKLHKKVPISMAEASACKLYCARATTEVALEAIQIMGGNGYMREYHVEMLMRDAKLLQIGGGTDEIQIITVARHS